MTKSKKERLKSVNTVHDKKNMIVLAVTVAILFIAIFSTL